MAQANRSIEVGTGLFVLLGFAALAFLTTQLPDSGLQLGAGVPSYSVTAQFDDIGGLKVGAPVTIAGVHIGQVSLITIDPSDYRASVTLAIEDRFASIPDDSNAAIQTSGLLGANYVAVTAGASDKFLHQGSQIAFTQSALVLENLINKFFANSANNGGSGSGAGASGPSAPSGSSGSSGPSSGDSTNQSTGGSSKPSDGGAAGRPGHGSGAARAPKAGGG